MSDTEKSLLKALIHKALIRIKKEGPTDEYYGICGNVTALLPSKSPSTIIYDIISELAEGWPKHSGAYHYPIPSTNKKFSAGQYYEERGGSNYGKLWCGKQQKLRFELIDYMIEKLSNQLVERP